MKKNNTLNKKRNSLISLALIILLMFSILTINLVYNNNLIGQAATVFEPYSSQSSIQIKEVNSIEELSQLNEGWYKIINGYAYYLETFDSGILLYIKVKDSKQQNGLIVVDSDGNVEFEQI